MSVNLMDFFKKVNLVLASIADSDWNSIVGSMSSDIFDSAEIVNVNQINKRDPGQRGLSANITDADEVDRIISYMLEVWSCSLSLQQYSDDLVPINRVNLVQRIRELNRVSVSISEWLDLVMNNPDYSASKKFSAKDAYEKCVLAFKNFNEILNKIKSGAIPMIWVTPDRGNPIPEVIPLPNRSAVILSKSSDEEYIDDLFEVEEVQDTTYDDYDNDDDYVKGV